MSAPVIPHWTAIAAMADNRVIGADNGIPWHLPEDFKFFKQTTMGHVLAMGRKTWDSIGRPLPGRETLVISRSTLAIKGATVLASLEELAQFGVGTRTVFICGGGELYRQTLPRCAELLLTRVHATPPGDARMPSFEPWFEPVERLAETPEFEIIRYRRRHT